MGVSALLTQHDLRQSPQRTAEVALRWAIALAVGEIRSDDVIEELTDAGHRVGWERILAVSARERLLGPAWLRSGAVIRRIAPATIISDWRRATARLDEVGRTQLLALGDALATLQASNVSAVVLKGAALSLRAYGAAFLRDTSDLDLFVAARERVRAHHALCSAGWRHVDGTAPDDATYLRERGTERVFLEMHSTLTDDPLVRHLCLPDPSASLSTVEGVEIPAHSGPTLAPYLAVHLAKHTSAPLLWILDFDAIWTLLGEEERSATRRLAARYGVAGYLDLALNRARAMHAAARGDLRAQRRCGGASGLYRERHAAIVGAMASRSPLVGARVIGGWLARRISALGSPAPWSPPGRLGWLDRAVSRIRRRAPVGPLKPVQASERMVQLEIDTSIDIIRVALGEGARVWLVARGGSMSPTIRSGAQVLVEPRQADDALHAGDVVFAAPRNASPVIHRVLRFDGNAAVLRGDALDYDDAPVDDAEILGRVTHVRRAGRIKALGNRPPSALRTAIRRILLAGANP
jgi:putative nucleotidyltransferase-like protein/peptidase S24-like protein